VTPAAGKPDGEQPAVVPSDGSRPDGGRSDGGQSGGRAVKVGAGDLRVTRAIGRGLNRALARVTVTGPPPGDGPALLAVNHTALVDGPLLYGLLPRPVAFLVKAEVFRGPLATLLRHTQQIPVHRGAAERGPLLAALGFLRAGGLVGVFPEGTRGDGDVSQVQHGIAYLAVRSGAPVVPVAVHGTAARRGWEFWRPRRPPVRVAYGEPLRLPAGPASRRTVAAAAAEIHRALAAHVAATRPHPEEEQ
jgi:1-acyl-sn-glycerol-3-phosphate acyltransferase